MSSFRNRHYLLLVVICLLGLVGCSSSDSDKNNASTTQITPTSSARYSAETPARVLLLRGYHAEYLWEQELEEGILAGLAEGGYSSDAGNVPLDYFWMDTKRNSTSDYLDRIAKEAQQYAMDSQPDVVIVTDDNAIRLVVPEIPHNIPVVFAGLNADLETYGLADYTNLTGVLERPHMVQIIEWIKRVLPDTKNISCLFDASVTSVYYSDQIREALTDTGFSIASIHRTNSFDEWKEYVYETSQSSDVLIIGTYHTVRDENGDPLESDVVIEWMVGNSTIPLIPIWEFGVKQGALGGPVIAGQTQGYTAASQAAQILNRAEPSEIEIVTPRRGKLTLNTEAAERWGITFPLDLMEVSTIYGPGGIIESR